MTPLRIQRRRTKGYRLPPNTVCVTRPGKWGNPFLTAKDFGDFIQDRKFLAEKYPLIDMSHYPADLSPLRGQNLACWCKLCPAHADGKPMGVECAECEPCHVDHLLKISNR